MAYRHRVREPILQARIFLPKWFVKVVRPGRDLPDDTVQLHVPLDMSKIDIKNYVEKIYNVPVAKINTRIQAGKIKQKTYRNDVIQYKTSDIKVAYVILKEGNFQFPELFPQDTEPVVETEENQEQLPATKTDDSIRDNIDGKWFNL